MKKLVLAFISIISLCSFTKQECTNHLKIAQSINDSIFMLSYKGDTIYKVNGYENKEATKILNEKIFFSKKKLLKIL